MTQAGRPDDDVDEGARVPAPRPAGGTVYGGKPAEAATPGRASVPAASGRASVPAPPPPATAEPAAAGPQPAATPSPQTPAAPSPQPSSGSNAQPSAAPNPQPSSGPNPQPAGVPHPQPPAGRAAVAGVEPAPPPSAGRATVPPQSAPSPAAPRQAAPPQTAPSQAAPPQTAPSQAAPPQTAPSQAAPPQITSFGAGSPQTTPFQTAPAYTAPLQAGQHQTTPFQSGPPSNTPPQGGTPQATPFQAVPSQNAPFHLSPPQTTPPPAAPTGDQPETAAKRGRGRLVALLLSVFLLVGLLGAGTAVQLKRELPRATLATSVTETLRIPGEAVALPWPKQGSAELMIEGVGRLGGSGPAADAKAIGSVAKVMTAYVILQNHPLEAGAPGPSITVTAADVADYQRRIPMNQSQVPIKAGTKLTERDALEALMLPSANNVAHMLAVWDAGSEAAFVTKMNAAAKELGMENTEYTDPSGYLPTTVSTAGDQVLLGRAAVKMPAFAEIVELAEATIPVAGKIKNYNDLLGEQGVFGIKTGSTDEAGGCLLFASRVTVGDDKLILVGAVFNQPGANTPEQLAAVNKVVRRLLTAVGKTVKEYEVLPATPVGQVTTAWGETAGVSPAEPLKVVGWPGLEVPVRVTKFAPGPTVTQGQAVGAVEARPGAAAASARVNLRADATTADPSLWWKLSRRP